MDPNPRKFPLLSFVLSRLPHGPNPNLAADIEQPIPHAAGAASSPRWASDHADLMQRMPRLNHPDLLATMAGAVSDVAQTRSVLRSLGARPDHETVDVARARIAEIDASLDAEIEDLATGGEDVAAREKELRARAEKERFAFRAVVQLDEMHEAYEKLLRDAEERLETIYGAEGKGKGVADDAAGDVEMDEEVERILREAQNEKGKGLESVDLSGRQLRFLPEAFGRIRGLVGLDLSNNQLEVLPDAIAGLECLEELQLASNVLTQLPDSIGLLLNLKILDVSGNKLTSLPDSISQCRSLVELDASYNGLTYLPTNIGYELVNLRKLMVQLNKLRSLPSSICEMRSLEYLDAHFNELCGLPHAFGKLTNLRILDLSSNFSDLTELPESFGELSNLRELNLSNNQIHTLPDSFGLLENLVNLNLDQNPIDLPPQKVVNGGAKAVIDFMSKRIIEILEEERRRELEAKTQAQTGWLTRSTSMLSSWASEVSGGVADYLGVGSKSFKDPYLDRQL